ncbi:MAG: HupE/UreJ family protein [Flavobacteriales bacterium]|nr:HupE/UreJ family protein [Flavobacteriales bacterium]
MTDFLFWFRTGLDHIADFSGYDHILFLIALCSGYGLHQWRVLFVLITGFTLGHSLTLALSAWHIFSFPTAWTELFIALTIFITCIYNLRHANENRIYPSAIHYILSAGFGLIHGMGFSTLLKSMLGETSNILMPLFAFNVGIETGQILIVAAILIISLLLPIVLRISKLQWNQYLSAAVSGIALLLILERIGDL